ncbi:hypothetical protein Mgra_00004066 [Meloidogyne graminicola]|uniref:V-type proton ATPase subunit G n=1 Tax=Meloidogyne graminicola TaxID=189291 RepID=A0A8S9ZTG2_9BILA|nr:hypothetical protein Mgra_00004066 [Meloidogyne graminicola]
MISIIINKSKEDFPSLSLIIVAIYIFFCSTTIVTVCLHKKKSSKQIKPKIIKNKKKIGSKKSKKSTYWVDGAKAIGMLLDCEKRCEVVIEKARHNYVRAMDKAYEVTRKEIADIKKKRDEQHQKFIIKIQKEQLDYETILENENRAKLKEIDKKVNKNRDKVIDDIMKAVLKIQPVLHHNVLDLRKVREVKSIKQIRERQNHNLQIKGQQESKIPIKILSKGNKGQSSSTSSDSSSSSSESTSTTSELSKRKSYKSQHEEYRTKQNNFPSKK